ncbi:MAG: hypothetical protein ACK521_11890 [bacterium]
MQQGFNGAKTKLNKIMDFLLFKLTKAGGFERNPRKVRRSVSEVGLIKSVTEISKKAEL